jgi:hypothetical protein
MHSALRLVDGCPTEPAALAVMVVWMMSLVVFPYSSMAERVRQQREVHRALLVTGILLASIGVSGRLNLFGATLR